MYAESELEVLEGVGGRLDATVAGDTNAGVPVLEIEDEDELVEMQRVGDGLGLAAASLVIVSRVYTLEKVINWEY